MPPGRVGVGQSHPGSHTVQPCSDLVQHQISKRILRGKNKKLKGKLVRESRERGESLREMKEGWH